MQASKLIVGLLAAGCLARGLASATRWLVALAYAALFAVPGAAAAAEPEIVIRSTKGEFQDVKDRVVLAIENHGLVLNYTARIGPMLERTGKDIGRTRAIYGNAESLEFCSARLSRDTMEADPRNIAFCPYALAIYSLPKEPGRVYIAYRRLGAFGSKRSIQSLEAVNKLLADIVSEALK